MTVEGIAVVAIIAAALVALVGLVAWWRVRLVQAEAALKQEAIRKGLSLADIEHLLELPTADSPADTAAVATVARDLAAKGVSGVELEQAVALIQSADSPTRQTVAQAFFQMLNFGPTPAREQLLAVIRGCCSAARAKVNAEGDLPADAADPGAGADGSRDTGFSELPVAQRGRRS